MPKNITVAIPYLMKAKDKGSLSSIIKRVNTTVIPPRDVDRDAQKTPKRVVLRLLDGDLGFKFIRRLYSTYCFRDKGMGEEGQAPSCYTTGLVVTNEERMSFLLQVWE